MIYNLIPVSMNRLYLLRHAEAAWPENGGTDHQRTLTAHGISTAHQVGTLFQDRGWHPDLALVSSARRTQETFDHLVQGGLPRPNQVDIRDNLYLCGRDELANSLQNISGDTNQVLMINHNPDLPNLVEWLCRHHHQPQPVLLKEVLSDFTPGSLAVIEGGAWADIALGWGQLVDVVKGL